MKKAIQFLAALLVSMAAIAPAMAQTDNQCGDSLYWSISGDTLYITGYGAMTDYTYDSDAAKSTAPWIDSTFTHVSFPQRITSIGHIAFYDCTSLISIDLSGCTELTSIGRWAFFNCTSLETVDLPESLTSIENYTFSNCTSLEAVDLSGCTALTSIGQFAFNNCTSLETVDLPESLTSIENYTFFNCTSLETVDLSGCTALTSIGIHAFNSCTSLTQVELPSSLASIGNYAFQYCKSLETMTVQAEEPPTIQSNTFSGVDKENCLLYVPENSVDDYKAANYWKEFFNIQAMSGTGEEGEGGSGIDSAASLATKVTVNGLDVELSVEAGTQVNVYSISGQLVLKTTASRFTLPSAGIYIITANGEAIKVAAH